MRTLTWLSLLVAVSVPPAVSAQTPAPTRSESLLQPGDSIRITVWRKPEMSGDFVITPDGSIAHPLYRTVKVAGTPYATVESNLRRFLSTFETDPQFVFEPLIVIGVTGQVPRPQVFAVRPETPIAVAVARAGGVNTDGNPGKVRVLRTEADGRQRELTVNLNDPERGLGLSPVRSGDQIVVSKKTSFFKDVFLPVISIVGSAASVGLLIERATRGQ
jgi:polysaccharide export outer membrane protein